MVYRKAIDERFDGNGNLKAEFRTPGIKSYISRAKSAGVPEDQTDFRNGEDALYAELILRIIHMPGNDPWSAYEQAVDYEDMLWTFLDGYGIKETDKTGCLIPRKSCFFALLGKIENKRAGIQTGKLPKRVSPPELTAPFAYFWARDKDGNLLNQTRTGKPRARKSRNAT
jgi:hypothetical protein